MHISVCNFREYIAHSTDLTEARVQVWKKIIGTIKFKQSQFYVWFQNRRAKYRKEERIRRMKENPNELGLQPTIESEERGENLKEDIK